MSDNVLEVTFNQVRYDAVLEPDKYLDAYRSKKMMGRFSDTNTNFFYDIIIEPYTSFKEGCKYVNFNDLFERISKPIKECRFRVIFSSILSVVGGVSFYLTCRNVSSKSDLRMVIKGFFLAITGLFGFVGLNGIYEALKERRFSQKHVKILSDANTSQETRKEAAAKVLATLKEQRMLHSYFSDIQKQITAAEWQEINDNDGKNKAIVAVFCSNPKDRSLFSEKASRP